MKKFAAIIIAALTACISLTGCSSRQSTLKIGVSLAYPPFEYYEDGSDVPQGVDIDLSNELAGRLGMKAEFVDTDFNDIFTGLDEKKYDVIISAVTITPEREEAYSFSSPYITNYPCIVTQKYADIKPSDPSELDGLSVCYQRGTTSESYINGYIDDNNMNCDTYAYYKIVSCFEELALGRVDAVFVDSTVAYNYCLAPDSVYEITWQQQDNPEEFAIVIPKDNTELQGRINQALEEMKTDGTLAAILDKYF